MKVKTSYVPIDIDHITVDKEYEVIPFIEGLCLGENDQGDELIICLGGYCAHLDGDYWEVVGE